MVAACEALHAKCLAQLDESFRRARAGERVRSEELEENLRAVAARLRELQEGEPRGKAAPLQTLEAELAQLHAENAEALSERSRRRNVER